ncbi:hypothetical protein BUE80_DR011748 [Diplocarpon rosae]|nr:hypothetical protein BUE80_DR011748 [Diplocarpon rosae]
MAGIAPKDVEILIHTTAPSRGQDDARYRALAQAYLDFQPAKRRRIGEEITHLTSARSDVEVISHPGDGLLPSTQEDRDSQASFYPDYESSSEEEEPLQFIVDEVLDCSQLINSPDLSFNSAADNADSPIFRARITCHKDGSVAQENQEEELRNTWVSPPSVVADSQPENINPMRNFSSPTRMLELYLQNQESQATDLNSAISTPPRRNESSSLDLPAGMGGVLSTPSELKCNSPGSQLGSQSGPSLSTEYPTQFSPSPVKGRRFSNRILEAQSRNTPSTHDPQLGLKRRWDGSRSGEPRHSSAPSKATGPSAQHPTSTHTLLVRPEKRLQIESLGSDVVSSSQPRLSSSNPEIRASSFSGPLVWAEKCEIRPQVPATSMGNLTPEMLLTASLARFQEELARVSIVPAYQRRGVRDMERGYWLLNCEGWDEMHRHECWERLGNFVGSDHAGWGVWCIRDECFREIRVYCFGFVAGQVYLLLYMVSLGKIKKAGLCWKGGDGETIIRMPS